MKKISFFLVNLLLIGLVFSQTNSVHNFQAITIAGDTIQMSKYAGKKLLIVNTASYCGFTPQFTDLEKLYQDYKAYNFEILGFPCNDFGSQDPFADSTIYQFCTSKYNVTFPMMEKVKVISSPVSPIYEWLQKASLNGVKSNTVAWNFNKFLVDENGKWVAYYPSQTLPNDTAITNWIISSSSLTGISQVSTHDFARFIGTNIFTNQIEFAIQHTTNSPITIRILNVEGNIIQSKTLLNPVSSEVIKLDASSIAQGIYLIQLSTNLVSQSLKCVLTK